MSQFEIFLAVPRQFSFATPIVVTPPIGQCADNAEQAEYDNVTVGGDGNGDEVQTVQDGGGKTAC